LSGFSRVVANLKVDGLYLNSFREKLETKREMQKKRNAELKGQVAKKFKKI
jgi:hypothetical protein